MHELASYCSDCGRAAHYYTAWRAAGCPVDFAFVCTGCGKSCRLFARLMPVFFECPKNARYDWHRALAQELYQAWAAAAGREADLLSHTPAAWDNLDLPEVRLWLNAYKRYLTRSAA